MMPKRSTAPMCATEHRNLKMRTNVNAPLPALHDGNAVAPRSPRREEGSVVVPLLQQDVCPSLVIGRFWCEPCDLIGTVVRPDAVTEIRCPKCGELTVSATG